MSLSLCAWLTWRSRHSLATSSRVLFLTLLILHSSLVLAQVPSLTANPLQEVSTTDLVRRALSSNAELAAARFEIERGRARLRQAGLRPNPTADFEQTSGVFNSPGEHATSVGLSLPLELGGRRQRRLDLAQAEAAAAEAEFADRERRLANDVRAACAEVMSARRELGITVELTDVDVLTARAVKARVDEGDAAPLELNLLRVEIERLRSRRALVEGRLQVALFKLRQLAGMSLADPLRLREDLLAPELPEPPMILETAIDNALNSRPDLKLARLMEEVARAGYRLAQAHSAPDVTAFTRYSVNRSSFDNTPIGRLTDRDTLFTYGVSISLPVFNRNQGAKAEAEIAISQAQRRREFIEAVVRSEVGSAWKRGEDGNPGIRARRDSKLERKHQNDSRRVPDRRVPCD